MEILGFVGTNKFVLISVLILLLWVSLCEAGRTKKEADAAQPAKRGWFSSVGATLSKNKNKSPQIASSPQEPVVDSAPVVQLRPGILASLNGFSISSSPEGPKLSFENIELSLINSNAKQGIITDVDWKHEKRKAETPSQHLLPKGAKMLTHSFSDTIDGKRGVWIFYSDINDAKKIAFISSDNARYTIVVPNPIDSREHLEIISWGFDSLSPKMRSKIDKLHKEKIDKEFNVKEKPPKARKKILDAARKPATFGGLAFSNVHQQFFLFWGSHYDRPVAVVQVANRVEAWADWVLDYHCGFDGVTKQILVPARSDWLPIDQSYPPWDYWRVRIDGSRALARFYRGTQVIRPAKVSKTSKHEEEMFKTFGGNIDGSYFRDHSSLNSWIFVGDLWMGRVEIPALNALPLSIKVSTCANAYLDVIDDYAKPDRRRGYHNFGRFQGRRAIVRAANNKMYAISLAGFSKSYLVIREIDSSSCIYADWNAAKDGKLVMIN